MTAELKQIAADRIDALAQSLIEVSHDIHAHPELAFNERHASGLLCDSLASAGLPVRRSVYGLETAFESEFAGPQTGARVALLAEYDALPGIGHACGHNLIATSALGATLGLAAVRDRLCGTVRLLGTPAEEKGGGKELMMRAGAFDGVDAAMMIHPSGINLTTMPCICVAEVRVEYRGRAAHASAMPHRGINALDGLLLAYQAISNLRQHIQATERIHGIVTDGGLAPNIVPEFAAGDFYVRAANVEDLARLKPRVQACFEAGAKGSGERSGREMGRRRLPRSQHELAARRELPAQRRVARPYVLSDGKVAGRFERQHRHGQRQLSRPFDPSDARVGAEQRRDPPSGLREMGGFGDG